MSATHLMHTYAPQPVAFARGEGAWLWDTEGKRYLDALAGIAVSGLGHAHPVLTRAIARAGGEAHPHLEPLPRARAGARGRTRVRARRDGQRVLLQLGRGGQRGAIKLARLHGHQRGIENPQHHRDGEGVARPHARHALGHRLAQGAGRASSRSWAGSCACPTTTSPPSSASPSNPSIVAVLLEVLQGEGGIHVADADYLRKLRELCDQRELAADDRRGAERHRAHRQVVRAPVGRDRARRDDARQGARLRRAHRRLPRARRGREGVQAGQPRHHVRRRTAGLGGRRSPRWR